MFSQLLRHWVMEENSGHDCRNSSGSASIVKNLWRSIATYVRYNLTWLETRQEWSLVCVNTGPTPWLLDNSPGVVGVFAKSPSLKTWTRCWDAKIQQQNHKSSRQRRQYPVSAAENSIFRKRNDDGKRFKSNMPSSWLGFHFALNGYIETKLRLLFCL